MGNKLDDFLNSSCAKSYGCYLNQEYDPYVYCKKYKDTSGNWKSSNNSTIYKPYEQLKECIESNAVSNTGISKANTSHGKIKYTCTYNVTNEVLCPPEGCGDPIIDPIIGLSVIYRNINLSNPFPGILGTGRVPGSNWRNSEDISNIITNNRGVTTDRVYFDRDPLYKITLTPAIIKDIRQYNQQQSSLDAGYADFEMLCDPDGTKCLSNFIRASRFTNLFSGCGIGKQTDPSRCVQGEVW
jgi:hypothetical protein